MYGDGQHSLKRQQSSFRLRERQQDYHRFPTSSEDNISTGYTQGLSITLTAITHFATVLHGFKRGDVKL